MPSLAEVPQSSGRAFIKFIVWFEARCLLVYHQVFKSANALIFMKEDLEIPKSCDTQNQVRFWKPQIESHDFGNLMSSKKANCPVQLSSNEVIKPLIINHHRHL
jgi:hypothetical protein